MQIPDSLVPDVVKLLLAGFAGVITWLARQAVSILKDIRKEMASQGERTTRTEERVKSLERTTEDHNHRIHKLETKTHVET